MTQMKELQDKARELGFKIEKGPTKFSGYILKRLNVSKQAAETKSNPARKATVDYLIDDDELQIDEYELQIDEYPIGSDYKWGLAYIEDWLGDHAANIAAGRVKASDDDDAEPEVETSAKLAKVKSPSRQKLHAMLNGREDAAEIKAMMKSANVSVPQGPTWQDLQFEERRRQARKRYEIEQRWKTNLDSIKDPLTEHQRNEEVNCFRNPEKDHAAWLASIERANANFLAPESDADFAPKPATGFKVASIGRRKSI